MHTDDKALNSIYTEGEAAVGKEKVNVLTIILSRAFPSVNQSVIRDMSVLMSIFCTLMYTGKKIIINGQPLTKDEFQAYFDRYGKTMMSKFSSSDEFYQFYGAACAVAISSYTYTNGFNDSQIIFDRRRGGDMTDRLGQAVK
jgi:hypothetical protein